MDWTDAKVEGDRQSRMEVLPDTHFLILDHAVCFGQTLFSQSPFHTHVALRCTVTGEKVTSLFPWVLSVFVWVFNALPGPPLSLLIHPAPLHHYRYCIRYPAIALTIFLPIECNIKTRAPFRLRQQNTCVLT